MRFYGGQPVNMGNAQFFAGNPFGADFVIPPQQRPQNPGPQLYPINQTPVRIFPKDQPGREGAIDVRFRQAQLMPGMPFLGNTAGLLSSQVPAGFQNKLIY